MGELLLTELAMCAAVIVVAAAVMVLPRLRRSDQSRQPVEGRGTVAELFDERMPGRAVADPPGLSHDAMERDPGASVPAGPQQAAETPADGVAGADLGSAGLTAEPTAAAGAVTISERIGGYYEEAERSVADYLAAHGWPDEQGEPPRVADAQAAPASPEPTARRRLAA